MAICVQGLDSAMLYAFLWLRGEETALKYDRKAFMMRLYM